MSKKVRLEELYDQYRKEFQGKEIVAGEGNPDCRLLLVGEAPGKDEVKLSKPFVGAAGKNLNEFLQLLELSREEIYITNAIKFRLSKVNPESGRISNRPATRDEIKENRSYLVSEITIIKSEFIVTLGNVPLKSVTNDSAANIGEMHGMVHKIDVDGSQHQLFPLYHPASIIYNRSLKEVYINDILKLKEITKK